LGSLETFAGLRVVVELSSGNFECAEALLGLALDPAGFPVPREVFLEVNFGRCERKGSDGRRE